MRTVVLISGSGSNLQAFIDRSQTGQLKLDIPLVISNQADAYGLTRAQHAGIATQVIEHQAFANRLSFDRALIEAIDSVNAELIILAGFMRILTAEFVTHYQHRLINIHPSLLPKYPGTNTHQKALAAGDLVHGASVHFVVPEVDAGPIIIRGQLAINEADTIESLQQRIHLVEHRIYPQAVQWISDGRLSIKNGEVLLDGETSPTQLQCFDV